MALCTRCGDEAAEWSQLCPSCRQSYRHLLRGSADHGSAYAQRGQHRLPLISVPGLAAPLPLARALAACPRLTQRWRHLLPGGDGRHSPTWSVTAAAFVGLVVAAVAATLCLAGLGSRPASGTSTAASPASTTESVATHALAPPATGLVTISAAARSAPHAPAVSRFVSRYFAAVSGHDYPAYQMMLADVARPRQSLDSFDSRYGAAAVSGVTLISITAVSPGRADVSVRFASRQSGAAPACAHWLVLLRLVKRHGEYLLSSAASTRVSSGAGCG